jgi:hypothetical protein
MMDEVGGSRANLSEETSPGVTETVQQAASSAADSIQEAASSVAGTAQEAVSGVVDKVQDVTGAVSEQANRVTDAAASQVESLANTVYQQAATPGAPALQRNVAATTANVLDRTAEYLREGDTRLILDDLRAAIRRHPGRSLLIGLGLGYLARSTFFGGGSTQQRGDSTRGAQPLVPRSQAVPVYGGAMTGDVGGGYSSPSTMSGSTLSGDMALGADLGVAQSSLSASSGYGSSLTGAGDTSLGYSGTTNTESISGGLSDVSSIGAATGSSDLAGSTIGTAYAPSDTGSIMQDDLTGEDMLDSDDVFVAGSDVTALDSTDDVRTLGGEDLSSDTSTTNTMPSDDLLSQWDTETRKHSDES